MLSRGGKMPLNWSVQELMQYQDEGFTLDETLTITDLNEWDQEVRDVSPVRITGFAEIKSKLLSFHMTLEGDMILPCSVTLEDVPYSFHIQTSETFRLDQALDIEDGQNEEIHDVENNTIDLVPYIKEAILVEKPIRIVSDKAKQQPKPSGKGWELVTEEDQKNKVDPRLQKLKQFYDD